MKKLILSVMAIVFLTAWCGMNGLAVAKSVAKVPYKCAPCKPVDGKACPQYCVAGRL